MTPAESSYDLPKAKQLAETVIEKLRGAAAGAAPADQAKLQEIIGSYQGIMTDFEQEYLRLDAEADSMRAEARRMMEEAQALLVQAKDKIRQAQELTKPDEALGARLRDELLKYCMTAPPPAALPEPESLGGWVLSPQPLPPLESWRSPAPAAAALPGDSSHQNVASWLFSSGQRSADAPSNPQEAWKQWLGKSQTPESDPGAKE